MRKCSGSILFHIAYGAHETCYMFEDMGLWFFSDHLREIPFFWMNEIHFPLISDVE